MADTTNDQGNAPETTRSPLRAQVANPPGITTPAPAPKPVYTPSRRVAGSTLVPKLDTTPGVSSREFFYWVGVMPACPVESLDIAGINFPKVTEIFAPSPGQQGKFRRIPRIGSIVTMDARRVKMLQEALPRKVIRFLSEPEAKAEQAAAERAATGGGRMQNLGDLAQRPRRGYPITIPSDAERKVLEERSRFRPFIPKQNDEPAARYLFMVLCPDQVNPAPGGNYPDPVEIAGLEYPPA